MATQKLRSKKKPQKKLNDNQTVKYDSKSLLEVKEQKNIDGNKKEVKNEEGASIKVGFLKYGFIFLIQKKFDIRIFMRYQICFMRVSNI